MARRPVLRLHLWFCKIEPVIARSRQKESNADYRSYCQFTGFISEKLTFEMPCISIDFLTTSSPAEGKVRSIEVTAAGGESAHRV